MTPPRILLVEDEPFLARVVKDSLEQRGYQVSQALDGQQALSRFQQETFALGIIDVMLPQLDGYTLVRRLRSFNVALPILFLTARVANPDVVEGYASGGNDYLRKPFSLDELFLRVHELLKRAQAAEVVPDSGCLIGQYQFVAAHQTLLLAGQPPVRLSHREAQLLQLLYQQRNQVLCRKDALLSLWGDDSPYHARTMDVFITKLRKHLKGDPMVAILNLRGVGYKLVC